MEHQLWGQGGFALRSLRPETRQNPKKPPKKTKPKRARAPRRCWFLLSPTPKGELRGGALGLRGPAGKGQGSPGGIPGTGPPPPPRGGERYFRSHPPWGAGAIWQKFDLPPMGGQQQNRPTKSPKNKQQKLPKKRGHPTPKQKTKKKPQKKTNPGGKKTQKKKHKKKNSNGGRGPGGGAGGVGGGQKKFNKKTSPFPGTGAPKKKGGARCGVPGCFVFNKNLPKKKVFLFKMFPKPCA